MFAAAAVAYGDGPLCAGGEFDAGALDRDGGELRAAGQMQRRGDIPAPFRRMIDRRRRRQCMQLIAVAPYFRALPSHHRLAVDAGAEHALLDLREAHAVRQRVSEALQPVAQEIALARVLTRSAAHQAEAAQLLDV